MGRRTRAANVALEPEAGGHRAWPRSFEGHAPQPRPSADAPTAILGAAGLDTGTVELHTIRALHYPNSPLSRMTPDEYRAVGEQLPSFGEWNVVIAHDASGAARKAWMADDPRLSGVAGLPAKSAKLPGQFFTPTGVTLKTNTEANTNMRLEEFVRDVRDFTTSGGF